MKKNDNGRDQLYPKFVFLQSFLQFLVFLLQIDTNYISDLWIKMVTNESGKKIGFPTPEFLTKTILNKPGTNSSIKISIENKN